MKLETFSYLAPMTEAQLRSQIKYILDKGYAASIEFSKEVNCYNAYWSMWSLPMFQVKDAAAVIYELNACRKAHEDCYIKITGYDAVSQGQAVSFVAYTPAA